MIIDDDLDICEALTVLLQTRYRLISCGSFEEAQQKLTPDIRVALLDIKMAAKCGLEVFNLLKAEHPNLLMIFHSAYPGSSEEAAKLERLNHNGYLTKGEYDFSELLTTIEQAFSQPANMCLVSM